MAKSEFDLNDTQLLEVVIYNQERQFYLVRSIVLFIMTITVSSALGASLIALGTSQQLKCALTGAQCNGAATVTFGWWVLILGFLAGTILGVLDLVRSKD